MSKFDEWFYEQLGGRDETQAPFKIAKMWAVGAYQAGAQSHQAEVCKLQTEIDELQAMYEKQGLYAFELQKRIDDTLEWIESNKENIPLSEWYGYTTEEYIDADDLLNILKGNQNEN